MSANVQMIDDAGTIQFRTSLTEPVAELLLASMGVTLPLADLPDDRRLSPQDLCGLVASVRSACRSQIERIEEAAFGDPLVTRLDVCGKRLTLHPSNPDHRAVMRVADLHDSIAASASAGTALSVYFVPDLSVAQSIALAILKRQANGRSNAELRIATGAELERRAQLPDTNQLAKQIYTDAIAQLADPGFMESIALFIDSGLVQRAPESALLTPTRKLQVIII